MMKYDFEVLRQRVLEQIDMSTQIEDAEIYELIDRFVLEEGKKQYLSISEKRNLRRDLYSSICGLDILQGILDDDEVTEIMVNGMQPIFVEKDGKLQETKKQFGSKERLENVIQQIVAKVNRRVNESTPIVDARLADGSRVNIVLSPIALDGPIITIRKFSREPVSMEKLISWGSITREAAEFLENLVKRRYNIFISGGTGSGKTTFLNALSNYVPKDERIITIEDSAELQIQGVKNLVRLESREANTEGENAVSMKDLIKSSLRMRPSRIIVGEVRGEEALDMLQAMNTGHDGSLSTGHSNSAKDMLTRLETMVLMAVDMPIEAIRNQIASALDVIVHLGRMRDKSRKVLEITEVCGMQNGQILLNPLFRYVETEKTSEDKKSNLKQEGGLIRVNEQKKNK